MDFTEICLKIIFTVFAFAFIGTACVEMGLRGTLVLIALMIIGVIAGIIEDKVKKNKEKNKNSRRKNNNDEGSIL